VRNYPWYKGVWKDYKDKDVVIIGIHTPETANEKKIDNVKKKLTDAGLTFPVAIDNKTTMWQRYRNAYWPTVYLIDRTGTARWGWQGELGFNGARGEALMREKIDELLKEKQP
jgi:AhpC/TSA family